MSTKRIPSVFLQVFACNRGGLTSAPQRRTKAIPAVQPIGGVSAHDLKRKGWSFWTAGNKENRVTRMTRDIFFMDWILIHKNIISLVQSLFLALSLTLIYIRRNYPAWIWKYQKPANSVKIQFVLNLTCHCLQEQDTDNQTAKRIRCLKWSPPDFSPLWCETSPPFPAKHSMQPAFVIAHNSYRYKKNRQYAAGTMMDASHYIHGIKA
jgi:hypothetical protein